jgi:hypothetical protein
MSPGQPTLCGLQVNVPERAQQTLVASQSVSMLHEAPGFTLPRQTLSMQEPLIHHWSVLHVVPSARRSVSQLPLAQKPAGHSVSAWHSGPAHTPFVHVPVAQSAGSEQTWPTPNGTHADVLQVWDEGEVQQQLPEAHWLAAWHGLSLAPHVCLHTFPFWVLQQTADAHSLLCEHVCSFASLGPVTPGLQTFYVSKGAGGRNGGAHFYGNLPLMLGINPSDRFSIVPSVGLGYGFGRRAAADDDPENRVASTKALLLQAGIGLDFRTSPTFAIHPEMSLLRRVLAPDDSDLIWFTFGLGFDWGALPRYQSAP